MIKVPETEIAAHVVAWTIALGWEVFQEVEAAGHRADIVCRLGKVLWIIEVKTSFGLAVLEQGVSWIGHANRISVATPYHGGFAQRVATRFGIGVIGVSRSGGIYESVAPIFQRRVASNLACALREEHKTYAPAGNASGNYYSPFKATCDDLRLKVKCKPGISMKEAVNSIRHHYVSAASARQSLAKWILDGKVPGLRIERDGKKLCLYFTEEGAA